MKFTSLFAAVALLSSTEAVELKNQARAAARAQAFAKSPVGLAQSMTMAQLRSEAMSQGMTEEQWDMSSLGSMWNKAQDYAKKNGYA